MRNVGCGLARRDGGSTMPMREPTTEDWSYCVDCAKFRGFYMVHDDIWQEIMPTDEGFLCLPCLQKRLGRSLTIYDFPEDIAVNEPMWFVWRNMKRGQDD